ncbi:MAG: PAS domain S-box protein, partial [Thermodesulfovibrionales bacterium]
TRIYTSLETAPLYDEAGNYAGAIAGVADITERRRMEEELLKTASIVRSSDDAIIGKSLNGEILTWNPGAEQMYGYSENEAVGKPISLLLPEGLS